MTVKLLTEQHLEFLSLTGGCIGSSESIHVKMPHCWKYHDMAHISTSDVIFVAYFQRLFAQNKEKLINGALTGLLAMEGDQNIISIENLEAQFHALRRLVASKAGFGAFTALPK